MSLANGNLHDERIAETEISHGSVNESLVKPSAPKSHARQDPQDGEDNDRLAEDRQPAEHQPPHLI